MQRSGILTSAYIWDGFFHITFNMWGVFLGSASGAGGRLSMKPWELLYPRPCTSTDKSSTTRNVTRFWCFILFHVPDSMMGLLYVHTVYAPAFFPVPCPLSYLFYMTSYCASGSWCQLGMFEDNHTKNLNILLLQYHLPKDLSPLLEIAGKHSCSQTIHFWDLEVLHIWIQ